VLIKKKKNIEIVTPLLDYIEIVVDRTTSKVTKLCLQKMLFIEYSGKDDDELAEEDNSFDISLYDENINNMEIKDELDLFFDVILANLNS